jgi:hypothetical protein
MVFKLSVTAALLAAAAATPAASLDAWAGVVAGGGNGSIPLGCTTFGPPATLYDNFTFAGLAVPLGGIAACGYSGDLSQVSAAGGPLTETRSLGPTLLGNPGYSGSFTGSASAVADFGRLGAAAHAAISGGIPGSQVALFESVGAARFTDTLTASSPLVAVKSAGFVRYKFSLDGKSTSLGPPGAYLFGDTYVVLDVQQQNGPVYEIINAHVGRGGLGVMSGNPPPAGWTTSQGSLSGAGTFYSLDLPMNWGQAWDVKVGLLAWAYGTADADFLSTARLTGVELFDANHVAVTQFSLVSASGHDYLNPVPEPETGVLMLAGLSALAAGIRRRRH